MLDSIVYVTVDRSNDDSNCVYHVYPDCGYVKRMEAVGKWCQQMTLREAVAIGRSRLCKPCEKRRQG